MREIVVGDVHGCIQEFRELLRVVDYRRGEDRLVQVGDLLDRGPDPVGCVRFACAMGVELVMGNHEEKALRWREHERTRGSGKNPMKPPPSERAEQWLALSDADLDYLRFARRYVRLDRGKWVAVHGGLLPGIAVGSQPDHAVLRTRWVDAAGRHVKLAGSHEMPPGAVPWMDRWDGPEHVVYGHAVHSFETPLVTRGPGGAECVGIDTGCVFGGRLTAMILENGKREFASVPAVQEWFPYGGDAP